MAAPAHIARENGKKGGRPKGSFTRPQIRDFFTEEEIKAFVESAKIEAQKDPTMRKFLLEQIFGKAAQQMEISGPEGEPLTANLSASDRKALTELRDLLKQPRA